MNSTRWVMRFRRNETGGVFMRVDDFTPSSGWTWVTDPWRATHFKTRNDAERIAKLEGGGEIGEKVSIIEVALVKNSSLFGD